MTRFARHREYYAGLLIAALGAGAIFEGSQYGIGTLTAMGSGFFPVVLGVGMILMGALMALARPPAEGHGIQAPNWRGAASIIAAVALFILLADRAGLAPATFACVVVGALGSTDAKPAQTLMLGVVVTVFAIALFRYALHVQFPILRGVLQ